MDAFRRFNFWVPITKATTGDDGDWVIEGPLSNPDKDLQGETMDMGGLRKGLAVFEKLGRNVDWEHLYKATKDPKWLIGKGLAIYDAPHPKTGIMVPWLRTKLLKSKEIAKNAIEHLRALKSDCGEDGGLGYSVEGGAVRQSGTHILQPIVTMVTVTPQPVVAENANTLSMCKSLGYLERHPEAWETANLISVPQYLCPITDTEFGLDFQAMLKALTATGSMPHTGPGIAAAEVEDLGGGKKAPKLCDVCERPDDECRCELLRKAVGYHLSQELALLFQ